MALGTFLANVISGWTPATTQNTIALLKNQDLQIAKISGTSFTMAHKMGLAKIRLLKSLQNVTDVTNTTTKKIERTVADAGNLYATENMESGYPVPLHVESEDVANESKAYYYVVPTTTTTFRGLTTDANRWQNDIEVTLTASAFGDYSASRVGGVYSYTGDFQFCWSGLIFEVPFDGKFQIECWGAQGGGTASNARGGYGGYTKGTIQLTKNTKLYIFVGNQPARNTENSFNGGGQANNTWYPTDDGGGATDIRTYVASESSLTTWNDETSLNSRIMVAGAGGGCVPNASYLAFGGAAGGLTAYNGIAGGGSPGAPYVPTGGKQNGGGKGDCSPNYKGFDGGFGYGGNGEGYNTTKYGGGGGGSGFYGGGGGGNGGWINSGAGGSSFISGHAGCVAITSATNRNPKTTGSALDISMHYSGYYFLNNGTYSTVMIDGAGYVWGTSKGSLTAMPNPSGGNYGSGVGHQGNGRCKITYIP